MRPGIAAVLQADASALLRPGIAAILQADAPALLRPGIAAILQTDAPALRVDAVANLLPGVNALSGLFPSLLQYCSLCQSQPGSATTQKKPV